MHRLEWFFVIAFALYTFVIWWHRLRAHALHPWMAALFGIGLAADLLGTVLLCAASAASWTWTLHTASGLAALGIMASHFVWAVRAAKAGGSMERNFNRFSPWAWCIWIVSFISGIPYA